MSSTLLCLTIMSTDASHFAPMVRNAPQPILEELYDTQHTQIYTTLRTANEMADKKMYRDM